MAVVPFNHIQKEYPAVEQMLENNSKAAVAHPMETGKSVLDGELAEAPQDVSSRWPSHGIDIFKTWCESVWRNSSEEDLSRIALFSHRNVLIKPLLALRTQTKLLRLTATAIRYLSAQKNSVEHFFGDCMANEITLGEDIVRGFLPTHKYGTIALQHQKSQRHQPRIDAIRVYAVKHGNLQALKFCMPPSGLELGAWISNQIIAGRRSTSRHRSKRKVLCSWTRPV